MIEIEYDTNIQFVGYFQTDTEVDKGIYTIDYYYHTKFFDILGELDDPTSQELYSKVEALKHGLRFEPDLIESILDHFYLLGIFYIPVTEKPRDDFYGGIHYKVFMDVDNAMFIENTFDDEPMIWCFTKNNAPILERV